MSDESKQFKSHDLICVDILLNEKSWDKFYDNHGYCHLWSRKRRNPRKRFLWDLIKWHSNNEKNKIQLQAAI